MRTLLLSLSLLASAASAAPIQVALPVGHTSVVSMPGRVTQVRVDDKEPARIRSRGHRLVVAGTRVGSTQVTVRTEDGEELVLKVYVAADKYAMPY